MKKISYITLLQVVSCIAVVVLHTNGTFHTFSYKNYWKISNIIQCIFYFGVPCFFMITGATLINFRERYSLKTYFSKRIHKTVIPFFAWSFIALIWCLLIKQVNISDLSIGFLYNGVMGTSFMGIYYFFPALFSIYLSLPLFASVEKESRKEVFSYLAVVGFVINFIIPFMKSTLFPNLVWPIYIKVVSGDLIYVIIGCLINEYELTKKQRMVIYFLAIAGFFLHMIGTYVLSMKTGEVANTFKGYSTVPCIMYSAGIFVWFKYNGEKIMDIKILNKIVSYIAGFTFGIYLVHYYIIEILNKLCSPFISNKSLIFILGAPCIVIPVSVAILWVMKKIPIIKRIVP